jgi:hypothetical protein
MNYLEIKIKSETPQNQTTPAISRLEVEESIQYKKRRRI